MPKEFGTLLNRPGPKEVVLPSDFSERLEEAVKNANIDPDADLGTVATKAPCQANCKGTIVRETTRQYIGDPMHAIIGPGYEHQLTTIVELYCSRCGIMYHHLPEPPRCDETG